MKQGHGWLLGPRRLLAFSARWTTKASIFWLEALAQILSLAVVSSSLSGDAGEQALRKGYSKDARLTNLLGWFWAWVASRKLNVFFVRVSSKANLSDAASRGDWEPSDKIGCRRCQPNFQPTWQLLSELAGKSVEPHAALFEKLVDLVALPPAAQ